MAYVLELLCRREFTVSVSVFISDFFWVSHVFAVLYGDLSGSLVLSSVGIIGIIIVAAVVVIANTARCQ